MWILDVLSGQIHRWNKMRDAARESCIIELRNYYRQRVELHPEYKILFVDLLRNAYTYYSAADHAFASSITGRLRHLKSILMTMDASRYRLMILPFIINYMMTQWANSDEEALQGFWSEMMELSCQMVGMSGLTLDNYMKGWWACTENLPEDMQQARQSLFMRTAHKRYESIAPILGLPLDDLSVMIGGLSWSDFAVGIARQAFELLNDPGWLSHLGS